MIEDAATNFFSPGLNPFPITENCTQFRFGVAFLDNATAERLADIEKLLAQGKKPPANGTPPATKTVQADATTPADPGTDTGTGDTGNGGSQTPSEAPGYITFVPVLPGTESGAFVEVVLGDSGTASIAIQWYTVVRYSSASGKTLADVMPTVLTETVKAAQAYADQVNLINSMAQVLPAEALLSKELGVKPIAANFYAS